MPFTKLLSPIKVGNLRIKNRIVMGAMHTGLENDSNGSEKLKAFYGERAKGGVGLIVTGGFSPNKNGRLYEQGIDFVSEKQIEFHKPITKSVHKNGGKIILQILHSGRYSYQEDCVAPSPITAPINFFKPKELSHQDILKTISDFARCAYLANSAGYDGVEIMGSEGYLINQFIAKRTNKRDDCWGGSFKNRIRFPIEIIKEIKKCSNPNFIIIYRLSCLDLVSGGSTFKEAIELGQKIEKAGVNLITTGIGWHESKIPTISMNVPRGAFTWVTRKIKPYLNIPIIASNRINDPHHAEKILEDGISDMVSMARPFLADENFVKKIYQNKSEEINTCVACNQACLDQIFKMNHASCMVNPRACRETDLKYKSAKIIKKFIVVGAGPSGLMSATLLAKRGHNVRLYEKDNKIGGQLNLAIKIPGKDEFKETLRYFNVMLKKYNVDVNLNNEFKFNNLNNKKIDGLIIATGVNPKKIKIEGLKHKKVLNYLEVLQQKKTVGNKVAIIGTGGIGIDLAHYLSERVINKINNNQIIKSFNKLPQKIYVLQRSFKKIGKKLGKTTGWTNINILKSNGVKFFKGVKYLKIDKCGLHVNISKEYSEKKIKKIFDVDNVIIAAGQEPKKNNIINYDKNKFPIYHIGGARKTNNLDARVAINEAAELCSKL